MGGYGSGRPGGKRKAEHLRSICVNRLYQAGHLKPGNFAGWEWRRDGEQVASIGTRGEAARLRLVYRVTPEGEDPEDIDMPINIDWTPCHLGGTRPFFICPGVVNGRECYRRVAKLFLARRYFLCRHCHRVAYACQSETPADRAMRAANKLRMAMGGEPGLGSYVRKPKGMHWATYARHMDKIERGDNITNLAFIDFVRRKFPGMTSDIEI